LKSHSSGVEFRYGSISYAEGSSTSRDGKYILAYIEYRSSAAQIALIAASNGSIHVPARRIGRDRPTEQLPIIFQAWIGSGGRGYARAWCECWSPAHFR